MEQLRIFAYGTLKQGFPLAIQSEGRMGRVVKCEKAELYVGNLYQDAEVSMRYFPYLIMSEEEMQNATKPAYSRDSNHTTNRYVDVIRELSKAQITKMCLHTAGNLNPVHGELFTIEGYIEELALRLAYIDKIESYEPGKNYYGSYIRRKVPIYTFGSVQEAWTYCMVLKDTEDKSYVKIEGNEWTDNCDGRITWDSPEPEEEMCDDTCEWNFICDDYGNCNICTKDRGTKQNV
jgi:gamma-glutamylcyclotransferase (GGCT)/AIG2-like uncharacterized protein YtfP